MFGGEAVGGGRVKRINLNLFTLPLDVLII